jgi:hypothetical protein
MEGTGSGDLFFTALTVFATVPVVSFADGLSDNSMDESDKETDQPQKRRKIAKEGKSSVIRSRKSVLKDVKRGSKGDSKTSRHAETRLPSGTRRVLATVAPPKQLVRYSYTGHAWS